MPGRPPKTAKKLKLEKGKLYGEQAGRAEIEQKTEEKPVPPDYFNEAQLEIWHRLEDILTQYDLFSLANETIIELLAYNLSELRNVTVDLSQEPLVVSNEKGDQKINPLFNIKQKLHDMCLKCCAQLGLSSSGLARLGCLDIKTKEKDDFRGMLD